MMLGIVEYKNYVYGSSLTPFPLSQFKGQIFEFWQPKNRLLARKSGSNSLFVHNKELLVAGCGGWITVTNKTN